MSDEAERAKKWAFAFKINPNAEYIELVATALRDEREASRPDPQELKRLIRDLEVFAITCDRLAHKIGSEERLNRARAALYAALEIQ